MEFGIDLLELATPSTILSEIIIGVILAVGFIIGWNFVKKQGWISGKKDAEQENTKETLREHLASCEEEKRKIYDKLDAVEIQLAELVGYIKGRDEKK